MHVQAVDGLPSRRVADLPDHVHRVLLELPERGHARRDLRAGGGSAGDDVPAVGLVHALQGQGHDLRERLVGVEGGHEEGADHVDMGLDRVAGLGLQRVDAEGHGAGGGRVDHGDRGADASGHGGVLGFGRFDGEPGDVGFAELFE